MCGGVEFTFEHTCTYGYTFSILENIFVLAFLKKSTLLLYFTIIAFKLLQFYIFPQKIILQVLSSLLKVVHINCGVECHESQVSHMESEKIKFTS